MGSELQVTTVPGDEETDHSPLGVLQLRSAPATRPEQSAQAAFRKDSRNGCSLSRRFHHAFFDFLGD